MFQYRVVLGMLWLVKPTNYIANKELVFHDCNVYEISVIQLECRGCYVSVSYRIIDAMTGQASELYHCFTLSLCFVMAAVFMRSL